MKRVPDFSNSNEQFISFYQFSDNILPLTLCQRNYKHEALDVRE